jgi:hypothetical protein
MRRHAVATKPENVSVHIETITLDEAQELEHILVRPAGFVYEARRTQRRINEIVVGEYNDAFRPPVDALLHACVDAPPVLPASSRASSS